MATTVPNPAQRLAALLASMKDDDGRVTIPGYYDTVKLTDAERRIMAEVPDDVNEIKQRVALPGRRPSAAIFRRRLQYPSLNIRGMESAAIGDKAANIIPSQAGAELDLRTTPGANPAYLAGLIEKHMRDKGYFLTNGAPTDEERARYDKIASLVVARGNSAAFTQLDSPLGTWAQTSLAKTFSEAGEPAKTLRIRMMGGSVPNRQVGRSARSAFRNCAAGQSRQQSAQFR